MSMLEEVVAEVAADPESIGLILHLLDARGIAHQWGPEDGLDEVKEHRLR